MAGVSDEKSGGAKEVKGDARGAESPAERRRRIEKMREKQELRALLDDFGDGDLDIDLDLELELEDEADDANSRYIASDGEEDIDLDENDLSEDDDDFVGDEFDEDD